MSLCSAAVLAIGSGCSCAIDRSIRARPADSGTNADAELDGGGNGLPDATTLACATDSDTLARVYEVSGFGLTQSPVIGMDVDGVQTTQAGDVSGCFVVDESGGVDNRFVEAMDAIAPFLILEGIDIPKAFYSIPSRQGITVTLGRWNGTSTDACVRIEIREESHGTFVVGEGALELGASSNLRFDGRLRLNALAEREACDGGPCTAVDLTTELEEVRARFFFAGGPDGMGGIEAPLAPDQSNATTSVIAGAISYDDPADPHAFYNATQRLAAVVSNDVRDALHPVLRQLKDLDTSPALVPCVLAGNDESSADSFSAAFIVRASVRP